MTATRVHSARGERLYVRLTADESLYIVEAAAAREMTVSDFVRDAVLKGGGFHAHGTHRAPVRDYSKVLLSLNAIGIQLRNLADSMRANGTVTAVQIDGCLAEIRVALARFGS
jgi:hypothetical protein